MWKGGALHRLPEMIVIGFHFLELYVRLPQTRRQRFTITALTRLVEKVDP